MDKLNINNLFPTNNYTKETPVDINSLFNIKQRAKEIDESILYR